VGSSPTASASMGSWSNRKTSAPHAEDLGAIPSESTLMHSPVVQRQRLLSYKQETMVQLHPGLLTNAQVRQLAERLGLNPRDSRFDSSSGHIRLGRQLADHLGLEPGMLWVRIPPELLQRKLCPRGAAWSARLPVTQEIVGSNPIGDAQ
jgi:hypothetical protein